MHRPCRGLRPHDALENASGLVFLGYMEGGMRRK